MRQWPVQRRGIHAGVHILPSWQVRRRTDILVRGLLARVILPVHGFECLPGMPTRKQVSQRRDGYPDFMWHRPERRGASEYSGQNTVHIPMQRGVHKPHHECIRDGLRRVPSLALFEPRRAMFYMPRIPSCRLSRTKQVDSQYEFPTRSHARCVQLRLQKRVRVQGRGVCGQDSAPRHPNPKEPGGQ